jgi:hypothetical protein
MELPPCTISFYDLPPSAEAALIEWLGEGDDVRERLIAGRYGYRLVPVEEMKAFVMDDPDIGEAFKDFDYYHQWYLNDAREQMPVYPVTSRWPVIATGRGEEPLDDGWHRLHAYVEAGDQTIALLSADLGEPAADLVDA